MLDLKKEAAAGVVTKPTLSASTSGIGTPDAEGQIAEKKVPELPTFVRLESEDQRKARLEEEARNERIRKEEEKEEIERKERRERLAREDGERKVAEMEKAEKVR